MSAPFVWIYVCFAAGIFASQYIICPLWVLCSAGVLAGIMWRAPRAAAGWKPTDLDAGPKAGATLSYCAQFLLLFLIGHQFAATASRAYENPLRAWVKTHSRNPVRITGTIDRTPEISYDYFILRLAITELEGKPFSGVVRLTVNGIPANYPAAGDQIETYARLRMPSNFRSEGAFDYEQYLQKEQIHALGSIKSPTLIHVTGRSRSVRFWFSRMRQQCILGILRTFPPEDGALLRALWLDDRSGLTQQHQLMMIDAGVFHVIAISGFHIAVVLLIAFAILKRCISYRAALVILTILLSFYLLILEGRSSILRSYLTFLIFAFSVWRYEKPQWPNVLALSALIQLVMNPFDLFDAGYHLTYLSTAAILFIALPLSNRIHVARKIYKWAIDFVLTTVSIEFVLLPYQAYVFHKIPFASLLANTFAIPISSILISAGIIAVPFQFAMKYPVHWLLHFFLKACSITSSMWLVVVARPSVAIMILFYGSLIVAIALKSRWRVVAVCICVGLTARIVMPHEPEPDAVLQLHFIDVGQGDAILIQYPDGTADLVDSGGFWKEEALDTGTSILLPYLTSHGITHLHRAFLTHAHADHMNGFLSLLRYIPADHFYVTRRPVGDPGFQMLVRTIPNTPIAIYAGDSFDQAGVHLRVLAPNDSSYTMRVANDDSLVLLLEYQDKSILLTGDSEKLEEIGLTRLNGLHADYIKVPHHGSHTSSTEELLSKLKMKAAFISVGANNWFGHPDPKIVQRYRAHHALVYRTDQLGTIRLRCSFTECTIDAIR